MNSILAVPVGVTATMLSAGTAVAAGSLANLVSNRVGQVARWTNSGPATYVLDIDQGTAPAAVDFIASLWSNLRATDTIRVTAGPTQGASSSYDSGAVSAYYSTARNTSAGTKTMILPGSVITARWWRITVDVVGSALPDGYLELSRIVLGKRIDFSVDYTTIDLLSDDRSIVDSADYGEDIEDARRVSFGLRPRWRYGSQAEMAASHQKILMLGKARPILFAPYRAADLSNAQDFIAFGKLRNPAQVSSQTYDIWELTFEIYSEAA